MLPQSYRYHCTTAQPASPAWSEAEMVARYAELLRQCSRTRNLAQGKHIHDQLRQRDYHRTTFLGNLTVNMYGSCGRLHDARHAFAAILTKNLHSWTILIAACVRNAQFPAALHLFRLMQLEGVRPDEITVLSLLRACSNLKALEEGQRIHAAAPDCSGPEMSVKMDNCLISLYSRCGMIDQARRVFDAMRVRDLVSWNTMIGAYVQRGGTGIDQALELYSQMKEESIDPDRITFAAILRACGGEHRLDEIERRIVQRGLEVSGALAASLISVHGRWGRVEDARRVFDSVWAMNRVTPAACNAMIAAYARNGLTRKALELFRRMQPEQADDRTFVSALAACAAGGAPLLLAGRRVHQRVIGAGREAEPPVVAALINMYSKCGSLWDSEQVFDKICCSNLLVWTCMMAAYARHGQGEKGVKIFRRMELEGVKPDEVTLAVLAGCLTSVPELRAVESRVYETGRGCSADVAGALIAVYGRCGAVGEAEAVFAAMKGRGVVTWTAMVWAYARNGRHAAAVEAFKRMKRAGVRPNAVSYAGAFEACCGMRDLKKGKALHREVAKIGELEGNVVVGNSVIRMYAGCGDPAAAQQVFERMEFKNKLTWDLQSQLTATA